jgi:hypothetical protein
MEASNKTYDGSTVASLTGGLLNTGIAGETLTFTGQTGTFSDNNVANGISVTVANTTLGNGTGGLKSNYSLTQPTGLTANIVLPIEVQNTITQMSNVLSQARSPSEAGNLSTTTTVITGNNDTMSIGNDGSTLKLINDGILLPANPLDLNEEENDA